MLSRKSFEELYGKYREHPKAVQSGFDGLPILEGGKWYIIFHRNDPNRRMTGYEGDRIVRCCTKMNEHWEYSTSCFMTGIHTAKAGCVEMSGLYVWFGNGMNCIVELPEKQQEALEALNKVVGSQAGCSYSWDLKSQGFEAFKL